MRSLCTFLWLQLWTSKICHQRTNFSSLEQDSDKQHQLRLSSLYPWHIWCQHYVTTSKEYLINCHILLQRFELIFLQLQLVKLLCKLIIIWVNYKKNKKGSLFMKHRVFDTFTFRWLCRLPVDYRVQKNVKRFKLVYSLIERFSNRVFTRTSKCPANIQLARPL